MPSVGWLSHSVHKSSNFLLLLLILKGSSQRICPLKRFGVVWHLLSITVKAGIIKDIIQVNVWTRYCLRWFLMLLAVYMASRPVSWILIFIRVYSIWELSTFRFLTWVIKWKKFPKQYWLFLHSSKDTANPFWHQVMASWYRCCCTHALAPCRNWNICFKGDYLSHCGY